MGSPMLRQFFMSTTAGEYMIVIDGAGGLLNGSLRDHLVSLGWNGVTKVKATVIITETGRLTGGTATPAFTTGSAFPAGSVLKLINRGVIQGLGGSGGVGGGGTGSPSPTDGGTGGTALHIRSAISIDNQGGIYGGGGGGGGGNGTGNYGGGGGGGGAPTRLGGAGGSGSLANGMQGGAGASASVGTPGGTGGNGGGGSAVKGGNGGSRGNGGSAASSGASGGLAGYYVDGNSNVTWLNNGTRSGRVLA